MPTLTIPNILDSGEATFALIDSGTFEVVRAIDQATPLVVNACATGTDVSPVTVALSGGEGGQTFVFNGVIISSYSPNADGTESVRFSFQTMTAQ